MCKLLIKMNIEKKLLAVIVGHSGLSDALNSLV